MKITTQVEITTEQVANLVVGAVEGGSTDWMNAFWLIEPREIRLTGTGIWYGRAPLFSDPRLEIKVLHDEVAVAEGADPKMATEKILHLADFENGMKILADQYPHHFNDLLGDNDDAATADAYMQCVCFGEIVFG